MNVALVLSGGTGNRMGSDIPKQYIQVADRMVITYCLETFFAHPAIDAVQVVAGHGWQEQVVAELDRLGIDREKLFGFSSPGANRQMSVYHGLLDIRLWAGRSAAVLVHDAARPCISSKQITDCLEALGDHDGVMPVLPMKDTVYQSMDGRSVSSLLDRRCIYAGQAPEVYRMHPYYLANKRLVPDKILEVNGSTEPAVLAGLDIVMVRGDENNFKLTTGDDMRRFRQLVIKNSREQEKQWKENKESGGKR